MPIIYGNVGGRKYTAIQPEHDPNNPKPTRYPAHAKSWANANYKDYAPRTEKPIIHGVTAWREKRCSCKKCYEAYIESSRRSRVKRESADGSMVKCRVCEEWKPREEFPFIKSRNNMKHVCKSCRDKGVKA